ncbi:arylformamidase [Dongia mobilis]|uniref:Arylformamidase n=1 Tax=Dongia mobilis TaxID=578943 RepID=A0A4R6WKW8_9PROT|nr:alpha/beta hydrolase [Dongia mobilis]TDQ81332.1 arylformamidase [Dongia mobilis]
MAPKVDYATLSNAVLAQHFMPRIAVPDHENWLAEDLARSAPLRQLPGVGRDLRYGPGQRQVLDVFPAATPGAPILIWFHGGYWRALSKDYYAFLAPAFQSAGAAVVLVNYDLCPLVTLADLLAQTRSALHWVRTHASEMSGSGDRLILAGNSAGAHISAMALQYAASADPAPLAAIRAAALITGIYDLAPVPRIPVQEELRLTEADIGNLSPMHLPIHTHVPALVAVGAEEPELWIEQSARYHAKIREAGMPAEYMCIADRHHFSITRDLADSTAPLTRAMVRLLET